MALFKLYDIKDDILVLLLGSSSFFAAPGLCISIANDNASLKEFESMLFCVITISPYKEDVILI